jgi:hypothetical protein
MARSVIVVEDDAQGRKRLRQIKCNVAPLHHPISFRIESVAVGQGIDAPRIVFDHGAEREAHQVPVHKTCMNAEDFTIERGKDGSTLRLVCTCLDGTTPSRLEVQTRLADLLRLGAFLREVRERDRRVET